MNEIPGQGPGTKLCRCHGRTHMCRREFVCTRPFSVHHHRFIAERWWLAGACGSITPSSCSSTISTNHRKRLATLRSARSPEGEPSGASRATPTGWEGNETAVRCGTVRLLSIPCTCAKVTPESEQTASRASELEVWR